MSHEILPPLTDAFGNELPEDANEMLRAVIAKQNHAILQIAAEIAADDTTIRDLPLKFAETMHYTATYNADSIIEQLEQWRPGSRQRIYDAIETAFDDYYPLFFDEE